VHCFVCLHNCSLFCMFTSLCAVIYVYIAMLVLITSAFVCTYLQRCALSCMYCIYYDAHLSQSDSSLDEYGVAAAILPLATAFYRVCIFICFCNSRFRIKLNFFFSSYSHYFFPACVFRYYEFPILTFFVSASSNFELIISSPICAISSVCLITQVLHRGMFNNSSFT